MRKRDYDNTALDLEYTIARHLNKDDLRVFVGSLRYKKALVFIQKFPKIENEISIMFELKSIDNKLVIKHPFGDKYLQNILEIEEEILSILNNFDEYKLQILEGKMVIY
jgi:hypothetical protein